MLWHNGKKDHRRVIETQYHCQWWSRQEGYSWPWISCGIRYGKTQETEGWDVFPRIEREDIRKAVQQASEVVNCFRNFYLWQTDDNLDELELHHRQVVNCFRNFYLWQTDDNISLGLNIMTQLWIAFEIFIFDRLMTTVTLEELSRMRCELLSKFLSLTDWWQPHCCT